MKPRCSKQRSHALTLVEVLVVIAVLLLFFSLIDFGVPVNAKRKAQLIQCVNNLKQIGLAYRLWAGDNGDKYPMEISVTNGGTKEFFQNGSRFQKFVFLNYLAMSNQLSAPKILYCPADTDGFAATNFSGSFDNKNVSYFVGLDDRQKFTQAMLSGDDNFEISGGPVKSGLLEFSTNAPISWSAIRHKFRGNILLADGSVQICNSNSFHQWLLPQTGLATNRLAIP